MWKRISVVAVVVVALSAAIGEFLDRASSAKGPFAVLREMHPEADKKQLLAIGNDWILERAHSTGIASNFKQSLQEIGFECIDRYGEIARQYGAREDDFRQVGCYYRYGFFGRSHSWRVSFVEDKTGAIFSPRSIQVCTACP